MIRKSQFQRYLLKFFFCYFYKNYMWEKENQAARGTRHTSGNNINSKLTGEANDYVLKKYRLEENKLFKQKNNEEIKYETANPTLCMNLQEDFEDELVIVPLEHPPSSQPEEELGEEENPSPFEHQADMVYVFDDDEDEEEKSKEDIEFQIESNKKKIEIKSQMSQFNDISLKGTARDNFSTAQLMEPYSEKYFKKKGHDPNEVLEKLCHKKSMLEKENSKNMAHCEPKEEQFGVECLKGVKIGKGELDSDVSITIIDKKTFSISKLPSGIILKCIIKRTSSILNLMSPEFDLYLANGLKHVLTAKRYPLRNRELFKFSIDPVRFTEQYLLGIMHANVSHNIYWLLDQPRRMGELDLSFVYLVLGYYKLKKNEFQRKFTVLLPPANSEYQLALEYQQNFLHFSNFKNEIKTQLNNLQTWNDQVFNSTKNFVLADEDDPDYRYLEMKKESDNVFELTIQHPLSPLQAMAIAMSRFDAQLN